MLLWVTLAVAFVSHLNAEELPPSCDRPVFCDSQLLHHVQMARVFDDSKSFVDHHMISDEETTLRKFDELMQSTNNQPTKDDLTEFVNENFANDTELEMWTPTDFTENPPFLQNIADEALRQFAKNVHDIWPHLGRKIRQEVFDHPKQYSLIPVTHGFIIPGGRFREIYYWDTYWIIEGLLISGMYDTARGMIENMIELVKTLGHVPNGSRWYYQQRSQPPLLMAMVSLYLRETGDIDFLTKNIDALEMEIDYWLDTQTVPVRAPSGTRVYTLLRYHVPSAGPRPESYYEDYTHGESFADSDRRQNFYTEIKNAAESGWDFSTRWFIDADGGNTGTLTNIHTSSIIPVDLNAMFADALDTVARFRMILRTSSRKNARQAAYYAYLAREWRAAIDAVLWDEEDGVWHDYDIDNRIHRRFFFPTNLSPLWLHTVDNIERYGPRVYDYLRNTGVLDYPGGVPSSRARSGEQWDFPNAWPPLVSMTVNALRAINTEEAQEAAFQQAQTWVRSNKKGFEEHQQMFEKYDSEYPGQLGGGGEYTVQEGFGWSNGVVLEFLKLYGNRMTAVDSGLDNK